MDRDEAEERKRSRPDDKNSVVRSEIVHAEEIVDSRKKKKKKKNSRHGERSFPARSSASLAPIPLLLLHF